MPSFSELLSDKSKSNIMKTRNRTPENSNREIISARKIKESGQSMAPGAMHSNFSTGNETIYASSVTQFIGQTPNLNSSLGVNAANGDTSFVQQNAGLISGILTGAAGLLGGSQAASSATPAYVPPAPAPVSKTLGMPTWLFWVLLVIIVLTIVIVAIKKMSK